jgi:hypothetical protein
MNIFYDVIKASDSIRCRKTKFAVLVSAVYLFSSFLVLDTTISGLDTFSIVHRINFAASIINQKKTSNNL